MPERAACLRASRAGRLALGPRPRWGAVEDFVVAEMGFRETHYKALLKEMELSFPQRLVVPPPPPGRRPRTFANPDMKLRFM